jgi:hypothetical protein
MNKIILFSLLSLSAFSQTEYKPISIIENVTVNKSKKEIYLATRLWFYKNFNSYEGVISVDDFENGVMYAKGILPVFYFKKGESFWKNTGVLGRVRFNLRFYFDDGQYKVIFDDMIHEYLTITSGNTVDAGMGLLTNNPQFEGEGTMFPKMQKRSWNLLQEKVPLQIQDFLETLKLTIEFENEMNIKKK